MGLDIYVGSLTRYYTGDRETTVQKVGRELGIDVTVIRPNASDDVTTDPEEVRSAVCGWMKILNDQLQFHGVHARWSEDNGSRYFTDKPDWDGYDALRVHAARDEFRLSRAPNRLGRKGAQSDKSFRKSRKLMGKSRYCQILQPSIWLPANTDMIFSGPDPAGNEVVFGSSVTLLKQLNELNERTWSLSPRELAGPIDSPEAAEPLDTLARFGFTIVHALATRSVEANLPMLLDG